MLGSNNNDVLLVFFFAADTAQALVRLIRAVAEGLLIGIGRDSARY